VTRLPSPKQLGRAVEKLAESEGLAVRRVRRRIATIALIQLFNLALGQSRLPPFMVKGGRALEFRFGSLARSSRDVDIVVFGARDDILEAAIAVLRDEWSGFSFVVATAPQERDHSYVFEVSADYNGADWARFELELIHGVVESWDDVPVSGFDALGLEAVDTIPCMTLAEQIAQKLHAVSDPDADRPRDLYDIYLMDGQCEQPDADLLRAAIAEFDRRGRHSWPPEIALRENWGATLQELLNDDGLVGTPDMIVAAVRGLVLRINGVSMLSGSFLRSARRSV
jgi:predicted nucleotidyltransferase component of viral defense system